MSPAELTFTAVCPHQHTVVEWAYQNGKVTPGCEAHTVRLLPLKGVYQ